MKLYYALAILLLISGCSGGASNKEVKKESKEAAIIAENAEKEASTKDLSTIKGSVPALVKELNSRLDKVKLPTKHDGFYNYPGSNLTIKDHVFYLNLKLEDRSVESAGKPINLQVQSFKQEDYERIIKEGYTKQNVDDREYLIAPNGRKTIVFKDGEYLYHLDSISTLMNFNGTVFSVDELIAFSREMTLTSEYKQYFQVDLENYEIPSYFTNDRNEPYWLLVGYDNNGQSFESDSQYLQISNNTMHFEQTILQTPFEPYGDEISISGNTGFLDGYSGFQMAHGNKVYSLRPAVAEVNQNTGTVIPVEIPNWEEEVRKIIESLKLPPQKENNLAFNNDSQNSNLTEEQQRESKLRMDVIKDVYTDATLDDSVFDKTALQFEYLGPEISVGYIQNELFKRYNKVNKDLDNLQLKDSNRWSLNSKTVAEIQEILQVSEINENEVFYVKDELKGEPTFYWILQMTNSYQGYEVINIYDEEKQNFLTNF